MWVIWSNRYEIMFIWGLSILPFGDTFVKKRLHPLKHLKFCCSIVANISNIHPNLQWYLRKIYPPSILQNKKWSNHIGLQKSIGKRLLLYVPYYTQSQPMQIMYKTIIVNVRIPTILSLVRCSNTLWTDSSISSPTVESISGFRTTFLCNDCIESNTCIDTKIKTDKIWKYEI